MLEILEASLTPNPVNANSSLLISVLVVEIPTNWGEVRDAFVSWNDVLGKYTSWQEIKDVAEG